MPELDRKSFFFGLATGVFLFLLLSAAALYQVGSRGVTVEVSAAEIGDLVRQQVERQVSEELPRLVASAKAEVPGRVAAEIKDKIQGASIRVGDVTIPLPPQATQPLQDRLQGIVQYTLYTVLDSMDTQALARKLGYDAQAQVRDSLTRAFDGRRFVYRPFRGVSVPVTIDVK